jgi:short subunit fatty acids transporter
MHFLTILKIYLMVFYKVKYPRTPCRTLKSPFLKHLILSFLTIIQLLLHQFRNETETISMFFHGFWISQSVMIQK